MAAAIFKRANQIRIIGGLWRGRKLHFPDVPDLRPTPDRIRETIFNWLTPLIQGKRCLDLYAGSGVLGLEALSRGANFTTFVDSDKKATLAIQSHLEVLNASNKAEVMLKNSLKYLAEGARAFDVVFLDPPYQSDFMTKSISLLENNGWLANKAMLYLEIDRKKSLPELPPNWQQLKEKKSGDVSYYLYQRN